MSSEREELAELIKHHGRDGRKSYITTYCLCREWSGDGVEHESHVAEAILAAGYRKDGDVTIE